MSYHYKRNHKKVTIKKASRKLKTYKILKNKTKSLSNKYYRVNI